MDERMIAEAAGDQDFRRDLRSYVARRGLAPEDVDDIVQETLARLVSRLRARPIAPPGPRAYAFQIAKNLIIDRRRAAPRQAEALPEDLAEDAPRSDETVMARQAQDAFLEALQAMPPLRREVFVRVRVHGQTHAEIGAQTGLSRRAIEKHVSRALQDLHTVRMWLTSGLTECPEGDVGA